MGISSSQRLSQRDILPGVIKPRLIGATISSEVTESSVTLTNGDQVLNQVLVENVSNTLVVVQRATYVGSASLANLLPGGSGVDESQFQVIGPFEAIVKGNGNDVEDSQIVNQLYIRNISAGTVTVRFRASVKFVKNEAGRSTL